MTKETFCLRLKWPESRISPDQYLPEENFHPQTIFGAVSAASVLRGNPAACWLPRLLDTANPQPSRMAPAPKSAFCAPKLLRCPLSCSWQENRGASSPPAVWGPAAKPPWTFILLYGGSKMIKMLKPMVYSRISSAGFSHGSHLS